jgi:hypothetical protein
MNASDAETAAKNFANNRKTIGPPIKIPNGYGQGTTWFFENSDGKEVVVIPKKSS